MIPCLEWNLLISSARACYGGSDAVSYEPILTQFMDWDGLLKAAARHGMTVPLHRFLREDQSQAVPKAVLSRLQLQCRANSVRNQQLLDELAALLTQFQAHGIPAIPYKGPALAKLVHGDLALRPCGDLDILLRPADVLRAKELLLAAEFQPVQQFRDSSEERQHLETDCEYNFQRVSDGILVELHWRFRPQFFPLPLDMDRLWTRAQPVNLGGVETRSLAPEDLLLILCVHGAKHCWERLCWICDIAALLRANPGLNWDAAWTQAKALGCGRVLLLGLALAQEILSAPLPANAPGEMPAAVDALVTQVQTQLVQTRTAESDPRGRALFHLRVRDRLRDRVPYVRHRIHRQIEAWKA